jgi:hypothetical protein
MAGRAHAIHFRPDKGPPGRKIEVQKHGKHVGWYRTRGEAEKAASGRRAKRGKR